MNKQRVEELRNILLTTYDAGKASVQEGFDFSLAIDEATDNIEGLIESLLSEQEKKHKEAMEKKRKLMLRQLNEWSIRSVDIADVSQLSRRFRNSMIINMRLYIAHLI
jgi:hypothetical protein